MQQNTNKHEITIPLPPGQVALIFGSRAEVNTEPAALVVGYYHGETILPAAAPFKMALRTNQQTFFEISLTEAQFSQTFRHLAGWLRKKQKKAA